jgi:hypothetical protein
MSEEEKDTVQLATELAAKLGGVEKTLEALAEKQRRHMHSMLWAQFAAGALADPNVCAADAAEIADAMLEEWTSRFEESGDDAEDSEDGDG